MNKSKSRSQGAYAGRFTCGKCKFRGRTLEEMATHSETAHGRKISPGELKRTMKELG